MKRVLRYLEECIWPRGVKCLCCDSLSDGEYLCPDCANALDAIFLDEADNPSGNVRSVYRYDGVAKQLVLLLKEEGMEAASKVLAAGMANMIRTMALPPETVLTWVTMPERRKRIRWIDHGRQLCEDTGVLTGLPIRQLLERTGNLHTQRGLNREARLHNLSGSFECRCEVHTPVLLIDDVYTTGATVAACSAVLKAAGAPAVYALTATQAISAVKQNVVKKG